jgi:uncharacterized membrane protein
VTVSEELRERVWLTRLERLIDVVFALVIWRLFMLLPRPDPDVPEWDTVGELLAAEWPSFLLALLGLVIVIVYWVQSNTLLGHLRRTDAKHTAFVIFQLFFVLFLLYAIGVSVVGGSDNDTRLLESVAAMLVGLVAHLAWRYAIHDQRLLEADTSPDDVATVTRQTYAEPVTAAITIPFALVGPIAWELSWFFYPVIRSLLTRWRARRRRAA